MILSVIYLEHLNEIGNKKSKSLCHSVITIPFVNLIYTVFRYQKTYSLDTVIWDTDQSFFHIEYLRDFIVNPCQIYMFMAHFSTQSFIYRKQVSEGIVHAAHYSWHMISHPFLYKVSVERTIPLSFPISVSTCKETTKVVGIMELCYDKQSCDCSFMADMCHKPNKMDIPLPR